MESITHSTARLCMCRWWQGSMVSPVKGAPEPCPKHNTLDSGAIMVKWCILGLRFKTSKQESKQAGHTTLGDDYIQKISDGKFSTLWRLGRKPMKWWPVPMDFRLLKWWHYLQHLWWLETSYYCSWKIRPAWRMHLSNLIIPLPWKKNL